MRMGNYFRVPGLPVTVMAASQSEFGMHHVTVVPTNFQTADSDDEDGRTTQTDQSTAAR